MKLLDLVQRDCVVAELKATDRNGVVRELTEVLGRAGRLDGATVEGAIKSIIARERTRGTTGFGKGVAAPHAKIDDLPHVIAALGRSPQGIDFSSLDGEPVYVVFLLLSPAEKTEEHLRAMDLVFRHLQQERFRRFLRQAPDGEAIYELLREADERQLVG